MRKLIFLIAIATIAAPSFGQTNELSLHLVSGSFFFSGSGVNQYASETNPFGKQGGISESMAFQYQYITSGKWIVGMQLGYQALTSKASMSDIMYICPVGNSQYLFPTSPEAVYTYLTYDYVSLYPFFGKRFFSKKFNVDVTGGFDFGICTHGESTSIYAIIPSPPMDWDVRLVTSSAFYYDHFGLSAGYAYGLSNYANGNPKLNLPQGHDEIYSRMLRIGLIYRFILTPETKAEQKK